MKRVKISLSVFILLSFLTTIHGCRKDDDVKDQVIPTPTPEDTSKPYIPTPFVLQLPIGFPSLPSKLENPLTVEGVELGRKLFHDKRLSADNTQSCASCHNQLFAFTDNGKQFSQGITWALGTRNSMPLFNLGWVEVFARTNHRFFWDGGAATLEDQSIAPIVNPDEMNETLPNVLTKLRQDSLYPLLFKRAFGSDTITTKRLMYAIAQFERTLISGNTRFDYFRVFQDNARLTMQERRGFELFNDSLKGDCFHCHNLSGAFSSDFLFHHNGHQSSDPGLARVSNNPEDQGKFRTPTLRNLLFTAPYMHDGRLATLEDVVEFYNSGAIRTAPADPFITKHKNGLGLTSQEKEDLVAFLKTLTDSTILIK